MFCIFGLGRVTLDCTHAIVVGAGETLLSLSLFLEAPITYYILFGISVVALDAVAAAAAAADADALIA